VRRSLRTITTPGRRLPALMTATAVLLAMFGARPAGAGSATAFVRVNQVGYVEAASKRAYLMASGSEAGGTFKVKSSSGTTVFTAPVGANLGAENTRACLLHLQQAIRERGVFAGRPVDTLQKLRMELLVLLIFGALDKTQHAAWKAEAVADRCHSLRVDDEDCDVCCQPMAV